MFWCLTCSAESDPRERCPPPALPLPLITASRALREGPARRDTRHCWLFITPLLRDAARTSSLTARRVSSPFVSRNGHRRPTRECIAGSGNLTLTGAVDIRRRLRRNDPASPRAALVKLVKRIHRDARSLPGVSHAGAAGSRRAAKHISRHYHSQVRGTK